MESALLLVDRTFVSPLDRLSVKEWGKFAHGRMSCSPLYAQLEHWYEGAYRLHLVSSLYIN